MQVNDLIFRELIKRGYSLEGKTRVWNIADSKLWYLTPDQAQGYLDLESDKSYRKNVSQAQAVDLLHENAKDILKLVGNKPFNLVDLGCGDGMKAALLVQELKKIKPEIKLRYCPIDISGYMVSKAIETFSKLKLNVDEIVEFQYNISDFENLENITPLLVRGEFKRNLIILMGNTLGNFEVNEFLYTIRKSMKKDDIFLVDISVDDKKNAFRAEEHSKNQKWNDWLICIPLSLGLGEKDVEFSARFKNKRIEFYYIIKNDKKVEFQNKSIYFMKGDQIVVVVAYKHDLNDLKTYLNMHFDSVSIRLSEDKSKVLALCTRG